MPLSKHSVRNLSRNELTRNLSGNIQPQSSQLAEPLWTDLGIKVELLCTSYSPLQKKKKKGRWGMNGRTFSPKSSQARKKPPPQLSSLHRKSDGAPVQDPSIGYRKGRNYYVLSTGNSNLWSLEEVTTLITASHNLSTARNCAFLKSAFPVHSTLFLPAPL